MFRRTRALFSRPSSRIASNNRVNRTKRLYLQGLEERTVPTVYTPVNLGDAGAGSLRQAIIDANADAGAGPHTVDASALIGTVAWTTGQVAITSVEQIIITGSGSASLIVNDTAAASATNRFLSIAAGADVTVNSLKFAGAKVTGAGAFATVGAANLTINACEISGNSASSNSGAIYLSATSGTLTISDSQLINNTSASNSGLIRVQSAGPTISIARSTLSGNKAAGVGGIIYFNFGGTLNIEDSTISGNSTSGSGTINLWNASATIKNSTFFGNTASQGGAVRLSSTGAALTLDNCTITGNTASGGTGGAIYRSSSAAIPTINSSIIAGNTGTTTPDIHSGAAALLAGTDNIIGVSDKGNFTFDPMNQLGTNASPLIPGFAPLGNYGGPTSTLPNAPGSVAINMGANSLALTNDQRGAGFPRVVGGTTDVGAYEGVAIIPIATLTPIAKITTSGATPNTVVITWADDVGIDFSTIDAADITITGPGGAVAVTSGVSNIASNGTPRIATYTFTVPGGGWDDGDNGNYTIGLVGGQVADIDGTVHTNFANANFGSFSVAIAKNHVVTNNADSGAGSFRQAITDANTVTGTLDTITFDASFVPGTTITFLTAPPTFTDSLIINGPGVANLKLLGNAKNGFILNTTLSLTITDMEISGFSRGAAGGALQTALTTTTTINNVVFSGNTSSSTGGGAIAPNGANAKVIITNSTFTGNKTITSTTSDGGAIRATTNSFIEITNSTFSGNSAIDDGGAIYSTGGNVSILGSTFSANSTAKAAGNDGGAITYTGTIPVTVGGGFTIRNSTFSGNSASSGGAMLFTSTTVGTATITNTTFTLNSFTSATGNGGAINRQGGTLVFESVIMSGNLSAAPPANGPDLFSAAPVSMSFGAVGTSTGFTVGSGSGNYIGTAVSLGALANNGGSTLTHKPASGSFVFNNGSNPAALSTDQSGVNRTLQLFTDMGALESIDVAPVFHMTPISPVLAPAATPDQIVITYSDDNAIDWTSIDIADIEIVAPNLSKLVISGATVDVNADGPNRIATYTFTVPGGGWDGADNGIYIVNILGTQVADKDGTVQYVTANKAGTFVVGVPASYVVDNTGDVNDGDYTAGNFTLREAVALANLLPASPDTITFGGAAFAGATTITLTAELPVNGNTTITGTGTSTLTVSGNNLFRIFNLTDASQVATFNLNTIRLAGGKSGAGGGGAILNVTGETLNITGCVFDSNNASAGNGGAIALPLGGTTTIASSIFTNNTTTAGPGGAIDGNANGGILTITDSTFSGNKAAGNRGGAISVASFTTNVSRSTFSGNSAANGGGLSFYGGSSSPTINNSTISGNSASTMGGGIQLNTFGGVLNVRNSTITQNVSTGANGGGIGQTSGTGTTNLYSTIVFGNTNAASPDLFSATTINADYSIVGSSTGVTTFNITNSPIVGTDPLLGPLQNNGGPTQTHALLPGSPALEAGDNTLGAFTTDQRGPGFPRILVANTDIGAFEGVDASPAGTWTPIGPITMAGATPDSFDVVWADDIAINWTTLGIDDVTVKAPSGSFLAITGAVPDMMVNGTPIKVTYTFTVPGGAWDGLDAGLYTVSTVAGKVSDTGASTNKAVTLGTFMVDLAANYVVDEASDVADGDFSVGKQSFREAVARSNATTSVDTITFDAAVFNAPTSIPQTTAIAVSQPVDIIGPAAALTFDATGNAGVRLLTIDVAAAINNAVNISNLTLKGGSGATGSIILNVDEDLTLTNVTVTGGTSSAAIYTQNIEANLTINKSTLSNNSSTSGGGAIRVQPSGALTTVTITDSTLSGNTSSGAGGAIYFNFGGTFTVTGTTFSGNKGTSGGAVGLWNALATFTNSTFFGNVGTSGGAISLQSTGASATLSNSTVAGNSATTSGGGLAKTSTGAGEFTLDSTIVAKNGGNATSPDIFYANAGNVNGDYNLIGISDLTGAGIVTYVGANNIMGTGASPVDPLLAALANNGGPTLTMLPAFGSQAIKAGSNTLALATDQRGAGFPRELTVGMPNIGAIEGFQSAPSAKFTAMAPITVVAATPDTVVVTFSDNNAIDWTTIDINDIEILNPSLVPLVINSVSVDFMSNGTPRVATYTFAVPVNAAAGWDFSDNGSYTVNMKATQVADLDPLFVSAGLLGTFSVGIPANYVVDITADEDDGNVGAGDLSLREAIKLANAASSADSVSFSPLFNAAQTITLTLGELVVSDAVQIIGSGSSLLTVSGGGTSRVFNIATPNTFAAISISGMKITGGSSTADGGGITMADEDVTLTNVIVTGNVTTTEGAGINISTASGKLTLIDSVVSNNTTTGALQDGGGINFDVTATNAASQVLTLTRSTVSGNVATDDGGGIYFFSGGTMVMVDSTVSGNSCSGDFGGGIYLFSTIATITNSTISGNSALVSGGGIAALYNSNLVVNNSTIVSNTAGTGGGGIGKNTGTPTVTLDSTIVAKNSGASPDIQGVATIDFSLIGNDTGATLTDTNLMSKIGTGATPIDPLVSALANNGGSTQTHALQVGSPAINAGQNTLALSNDQRGTGFVRVFGASADIGAFEDQPVVAPAAKVLGVAINSKLLTAVDKAQRSYVSDVAITFDSKVAFSGTPEAAFTLDKIGGGSVTLSANVDNSGPGTVVTLTFTGGSVNATSLADGRYALHALAAQFTGSGLDGDGNGTGGDNFLFDQAAPPTLLDTAKIFRIFGDYTGDGSVAANDFIQFRLALGNSSPPFQMFDFDNDGAVAASDFIQFRLRFGGSI